jgi:hypothetical protein
MLSIEEKLSSSTLPRVNYERGYYHIRVPARYSPMILESGSNLLEGVGYNRVSRNDLLFFASTAFVTDIANLNIPPDSTFWNRLRSSNISDEIRFQIEAKPYPQTEPLSSYGDNVLILGDGPSDISAYYRKAVFPILGDGLPRSVYMVEMFRPYDIIAPGNPELTPYEDIFDTVTSKDFVDKVKADLNEQVHSHTGGLCAGLDFFNVFDVNLYVQPLLTGCRVFGGLNVRPQDISPVGVNYWQ